MNRLITSSRAVYYQEPANCWQVFGGHSDLIVETDSEKSNKAIYKAFRVPAFPEQVSKSCFLNP